MEVFAKPGAAAIIEKRINGDVHILIQERFKDEVPAENGLLEVPAGKIREFENIFDCLRREVMEETGLEIIEIFGEKEAIIYENHNYKVLCYEPFTCAQNTDGYYSIMVEIFLCKAKGHILQSSDESKNLRWISLKELKELLLNYTNDFYPMHVIALNKYLSQSLAKSE